MRAIIVAGAVTVAAVGSMTAARAAYKLATFKVGLRIVAVPAAARPVVLRTSASRRRGRRLSIRKKSSKSR